MRLPMGLSLGGEQCGGFRTVTGLQAFLFAGFIVMDVINPAIAAVETESLLHIFTKQRKSVLAPRCVSFTQSDADKLPVSEFYRSFSGVLASRCRVSPSPPSAGSFAGSCNLVLHNSLMHKHRSWRRGSESNGVRGFFQNPPRRIYNPTTRGEQPHN